MCFVYLEIYYRKRKLDKRLLSSFEVNGAIAVMSGILFAILFQNLYDFIESPSTYAWTWAMTFFGGLIGGVVSFLLGYFLIIRKKYGPSLHDLSIIAPACITVAHGFGRIGCFLAGCCYGIETDSWLGVTFPGMTHKVYPTNLFEAIFLLLLSLLLLYMAVKKHSDYSFVVYMIGYGLFRYGIEFIRGDHRGDFVLGMSPSQFWSLVLVAAGLIYLMYLLHLIDFHLPVKKKKASN